MNCLAFQLCPAQLVSHLARPDRSVPQPGCAKGHQALCSRKKLRHGEPSSAMSCYVNLRKLRQVENQKKESIVKSKGTRHSKTWKNSSASLFPLGCPSAWHRADTPPPLVGLTREPEGNPNRVTQREPEVSNEFPVWL